MYAEIHSVDDEREKSPGKRTWINSSRISLSVGEPDQEHLKNTKSCLNINAEDLYELGTGERDGQVRFIRRTVTLQLLEEDLDQIIKYALKHGIAGASLRAAVRALVNEVGNN